MMTTAMRVKSPDLAALTVAQRAAARSAYMLLLEMGAEVVPGSAEVHWEPDWAWGPVGRPFGPERFTWGRVLAVHSVGGYQIVEYVEYADGPYKRDRMKQRKVTGEVSFHPWVDGRDMGRSFSSLDEALVGCIAWRADMARGGVNVAANSQAVKFIGRLLGWTGGWAS